MTRADVDAQLGALLAHAGPATTVVVISDHGMAASDGTLLFGAWHETGLERSKRVL